MELAFFIFIASCLAAVIVLANKLASDEPLEWIDEQY